MNQVVAFTITGCLIGPSADEDVGKVCSVKGKCKSQGRMPCSRLGFDGLREVLNDVFD